MKVIHIIPKDGLGGVEQAARSLEFKENKNLDIEVTFLSGKSLSDKEYIKDFPGIKKLNSFSFYSNGLKYLLKNNPDILISSLWRSTIISIPYVLYKRITRKDNFKFVIFIHANKFAHIVDKIITSTAIKLADEVWCDSLASQTGISDAVKHPNKLKVISFLVNTNHTSTKQNTKKDNFVFWGRLAKQKRVDKAIRLFEQVQRKTPQSLFYIYGPDCGELENLTNLVNELQLQDSIIFMGPKKPNHYPEEVVTAKFFVNTSSHEGMAIAVTEAMQLGLVPIVTDVGEVANYCEDGKNSIYYNNNVLERVLDVINNDTEYKTLSSNALNYWNSKKSYSQDFIDNCLRLSKEDD